LFLAFEIAPAFPARESHSVVVARLDRAIQYAAASRSILDVSGILGRPVKPGDDGWGMRRVLAQ